MLKRDACAATKQKLILSWPILKILKFLKQITLKNFLRNVYFSLQRAQFQQESTFIFIFYYKQLIQKYIIKWENQELSIKNTCVNLTLPGVFRRASKGPSTGQPISHIPFPQTLPSLLSIISTQLPIYLQRRDELASSRWWLFCKILMDIFTTLNQYFEPPT